MTVIINLKFSNNKKMFDYRLQDMQAIQTVNNKLYSHSC